MAQAGERVFTHMLSLRGHYTDNGHSITKQEAPGDSADMTVSD